jgi:hypothetical protein
MVQGTAVADWVVVTYTLASAVINGCLAGVFIWSKSAHPMVRARGVELFSLQALTGTLWALGTLLGFEHVAELRFVHASACNLIFFTQWVWGATLFMSLLSLRMHSVYITFRAGTGVVSVLHNRRRRQHLLVVHILPAVVVGIALLMGGGGSVVVDNQGCVFPTPIKIGMLVCVWLNMAALVVWLWILRGTRLPGAFQEVHPTIASVVFALPTGIVATILVMTGAWESVSGRVAITSIIQSCVNMVLWCLAARPLRALCGSVEQERANITELAEVQIAPFLWTEVIRTPNMRSYLWEWMKQRDSHFLRAGADAHACVIRWQENHLSYVARDIVSRFVEPGKSSTLAVPADVATPLLAFRFDHEMPSPHFLNHFSRWLLTEIQAQAEKDFITPEVASTYYAGVARYDASLATLEQRGLLEVDT